MTNFPKIEDLLKEGVIGLDTETYDPFLLDKGPGARMHYFNKQQERTLTDGTGLNKYGQLCGISIATTTDKWYFSIGHAEYDEFENDNKTEVLDYIRKLLYSGINIVGANTLYDLQWLKAYDIECKGLAYDCQLTESLLNENRKTFKLDALAVEYCGVHKNEESMVKQAATLGIKEKDVKKSMHLLPGEWVAPYGADDAQLALQIHNLQLPKIKELNLEEAMLSETRISQIALEMIWKGVRIDTKRAKKLNIDFLKDEESIKKRLFSLAGKEFNPWSSSEVGELLENKFGKTVPRTAKTGEYSITEEYLHSFNRASFEEAVDDDDFFGWLRKFRKLNKMRRDFLEGYMLDERVLESGRIFTQYHTNRKDANGTRSGRFSASNPSLQVIPSRDKYWKKKIRGLYLPEPGKKWIRFDYSQQEFRLFSDYALRRKFDGAKEVAGKYKENPDSDFHQVVADIMGIERTPAKTINFGILYGMGAAKMSRNLGTTIEDAKELLKEYRKAVPFAKGLANEVMSFAEERGYIKTIGGRRRNFNLWEPVKNDDEWKSGTFFDGLPLEQAREQWPNRRLQRHKTYSAVNALVQGGAADMTKKAILELYDKYGIISPIQVHDELDFVDVDEDMIPIIKQVLENVYQLSIPIIADCETGEDWGALSKCECT